MPLSLTELEFDGPASSSVQAFGQIGVVLDWIAFVTHWSFQVLCARVLPVDLPSGVPAQSIDFPGTPPGLSVYESAVGFKTNGAFYAPSDIDAAMAPDVRRGIQWYLHGCRSSVAAEQVAAFWIGLEAMTPVLSVPLRCPRCQIDISTCPSCGKSTDSPRVIAAIKRMLVEEQRLCDKSEVNRLYRVRSSLMHGQRQLVTSEVSESAFRMRELLMQAIKAKIGIPLDMPPRIEPMGMTIQGVVGLQFSPSDGVLERHQPGAHPVLPWHLEDKLVSEVK